MSRTIPTALFAACLAATSSTAALAWDYPGHRIVGAIADAVLSAHYKKAHDGVEKLLTTKDANGNEVKRTLSQVAVFADCAKPNSEQYCGRPSSVEEIAYVKRNPQHSAYHYTDVPLAQSKYVAYSAGTDEHDVVQMINFIVKYLRTRGEREENRPKMPGVSLTDTEAVWLLAHLVGDIHQPLHVGAVYFDKATCATSVDPNTVPGGMISVVPTIGGNDIKIFASAPAVPPADNLHLYWDATTVASAMHADGFAGAEQEFARALAADAPTGWVPSGDPTAWAEQWAAEIMPIARDAHYGRDEQGNERITITSKPPKLSETGRVTCDWTATLQPRYGKWAADKARAQLKLGGFRLAALLKAIFDP